MSIHGEIFSIGGGGRGHLLCRCELCEQPYTINVSLVDASRIKFCSKCIPSVVAKRAKVKPRRKAIEAGFVGGCYEFRKHYGVKWDLGLSGPKKCGIIFVDSMYAEHASEFCDLADIVVTYPTLHRHPLKAKNLWTVSKVRMTPAFYAGHAKTVECKTDDVYVPFWELVDYAYTFNRDDPSKFTEAVNARAAYAFRTEFAKYVQIDSVFNSTWAGMGKESYFSPYLLQKVLATDGPSAILCPVKEANRNSRVARVLMEKAIRVSDYVKNRSSLLDE